MIQEEELFIKGRYRSEDGLYRLTYSDAYGKRTSVYSKDKKMGVPDRMWAFFVNCVITWKQTCENYLNTKNSIIKMNM